MIEDIEKYWDNIHQNYTSSYDGWLDNYLKDINTDDVILELGCGRAYNSLFLKEKGYKKIVATDISKVVLDIIKKENPSLEVLYLNVLERFPFDNNEIDVIIADLSLHYFSIEKMKVIFEEIKRVLSKKGKIILRINSVNDVCHIPSEGQQLEENLYYDGKIYKKFFKKEDFEKFLDGFEIVKLEEKTMDRYVKPKVLWELYAKKI